MAGGELLTLDAAGGLCYGLNLRFVRVDRDLMDVGSPPTLIPIILAPSAVQTILPQL
jgi:hypothetical protein